jgi:general secretion pathway protein F
MQSYQYLAVDIEGRRRQGSLKAKDETAARADLSRRQLLPVQLAAGEARTDETAPAGNAALSHKTRLLVTRQLATLVDASAPLDEALGMIAAQQDDPKAKRILADVQAGVVEGRHFADALARHPRSFPALYRAAVAGGERAGKLGFVLTRLADYLSRAHAMRSKVAIALVYPITLSVVAMAVVACLMIFVVPSLAEQFHSFGERLPLLTRLLIGTAEFLNRYWPFLLLLIAAATFTARMLARREDVMAMVDAQLMRAPGLGRWVRIVNSSLFARAAATMMMSGLPVLQSVRAARDSVGNRSVAAAIAQMATWIEEGEPLSHAMRRSGVIPPLIVYMAASGENAGELPQMLEKAADQLDREIEEFTAAALSLFEPAIIVFMGLAVGSIVLAIMLPILQLNSLAGAV